MKIHPQFKLNGKSYSNQELKELADSLSKDEQAFKTSIGAFIVNWLDDSKTITVATSGSTGTPKQIVLLKEQMVNSALATGNFFNLKTGTTALLCLPCNFIAGKMMLVRAMVLGLDLDYVEPNSNPLDTITKEYEFAAMIPLQAKNSTHKLDVIQKLIIGGAKLNSSLEEELKNIKTSIYETYGMTETITHIAVRELGKSYFRTLPEVTIEKDSRDCLVIAAPAIAKEKVVTNDIVKLISDQEFKWLGRYDAIINSGGVKLIPEQIEAKLSQLIEQRFFVAGIPDEVLGQKLVLVVEGELENNLASKIDSLETLSKYEKPKAIIPITKFIESPNGKVLRSQTLKAFL